MQAVGVGDAVGTRAHALVPGGQHHVLRHPAGVEAGRLARVHGQRDAQRGAAQVVGYEHGVGHARGLLDHHEAPGLAVLGASGHASGLQDLPDQGVGQWPVGVRAHLALAHHGQVGVHGRTLTLGPPASRAAPADVGVQRVHQLATEGRARHASPAASGGPPAPGTPCSSTQSTVIAGQPATRARHAAWPECPRRERAPSCGCSAATSAASAVRRGCRRRGSSGPSAFHHAGRPRAQAPRCSTAVPVGRVPAPAAAHEPAHPQRGPVGGAGQDQLDRQVARRGTVQRGGQRQAHGRRRGVPGCRHPGAPARRRSAVPRRPAATGWAPAGPAPATGSPLRPSRAAAIAVRAATASATVPSAPGAYPRVRRWRAALTRAAAAPRPTPPRGVS